MYYRKFDDIFIVSPSHAKMGLKVKQDNTTAKFSLDWLFNKFAKINEDQLERVFGNRPGQTNRDKKTASGMTLSSGMMMND